MELAVGKMMHHCGLRKEWIGEGGMLHHCHGRLREEWDRERVVVASLMQRGMELGVGKMIHQCGLQKEWEGRDVASQSQWPKKGMDAESRMHQ